MTDLLEQAIARLKILSAVEQDAIADDYLERAESRVSITVNNDEVYKKLSRVERA